MQTLYPEHYSIQLACRQDYAAFYEREMQFRAAMRYPPVVVADQRRRARADLRRRDGRCARRSCRRLRGGSGERHFAVLGPAPAPLGKLRGEHRAQFFLKGTNRQQMREALHGALAARPELARRTTVDVDPLSVL